MCNIIASIYKHTVFRVTDEHATSTIKRQYAGIRQGCPLSPFLFIILLSVILSDIYDEKPNIRKGRAHRAAFTEWLFADDTLLILKKP